LVSIALMGARRLEYYQGQRRLGARPAVGLCFWSQYLAGLLRHDLISLVV
jgi:hypothetical protein